MKIIAERIFELSEEELEMIKRGLSDHISDYCIGDEDKPYVKLLNKLKDVHGKGIVND